MKRLPLYGALSRQATVEHCGKPVLADRRGGLSLLELSVAGALFTLLFVAFWQLFDGSGAAVTHGIGSAHLETALRKTVDRVTEELRDSGNDDAGVNQVATHPADRTTSSPTLTFQRRIAFNGDPTDWSTPITYGLVPSAGEVPDNGADDDGDGVVDEQDLARTQDGITIVVSDNVTLFSATRQTGEAKLDIAVNITRVLRRGTGPVNRSAVASVALRNR